MEFIFEIYLSGNGLEPTGLSQMALGELEWMGASEAGVLYYHLSMHVRCLCIFICVHVFMCDSSAVIG